jgi:thymidylate synthase
MKKMSKADGVYLKLLKDILENGTQKGDRTGTGTISVFGRQIAFNMQDGFPLLTTKKMFRKGIIHELLWFLNGDTNIKYLVDNDVHIWDGDTYKNYIQETDKWSNSGPHNLSMSDLEMIGKLTGPISKATIRQYTKDEFIEKIKTNEEFAKKWGELGPVYGRQWRAWCGFDRVPSGWEHGAPTHFKEIPVCDQIKGLIEEIRNNPDSRRLMVNAWNVGELDKMVLPPCHYGFQIYTRELSYEERLEYYIDKSDKFYHPHYDNDTVSGEYKLTDGEDFFNNLMNEPEINVPKRAISLMWNQRSVDTFLGLPFNIASYGFLLHMIAQQVNMVPDQLIGNLGDVHIYNNHIEQVKEQLNREPKRLPSLDLNKADDLFSYKYEDFKIMGYDPHPPIKGELSN